MCGIKTRLSRYCHQIVFHSGLRTCLTLYGFFGVLKGPEGISDLQIPMRTQNCVVYKFGAEHLKCRIHYGSCGIPIHLHSLLLLLLFGLCGPFASSDY